MSDCTFSPLTFYKCLSDETRLKSLMLLVAKQELCVCDLIQALELSQPKISRHLADLRKTGLVFPERRGKWVYYSIHPDLPEWAKEVLLSTTENQNDYIHDELNNLSNANSEACY